MSSLDSSFFAGATASPDLPIGPFDTSATDVLASAPNLGFDISQQPVDPTNSGDTGVFQNTSTPAAPGINNPETAGSSDLGSTIGSAINAAFAGWQLATQPKGTPKTITTTVGGTRVVSGQPSVLSSLGLGTGTSSSTGIILLLALVALIIWAVSRG